MAQYIYCYIVGTISFKTLKYWRMKVNRERLVGKPGTQTSQITFSCLKSTIKTLEKGVKYVES